MSYVLRFCPEVEEDVIAGYEWYEKKSIGLGEDFLRMFDSVVADLVRHPLLAPEWERGFRRRLLRRFPYAVYYVIQDQQITVTGFFHCARDPANIDQELSDRSER